MKNYAEIVRQYHTGYADLADVIPTTASAFGRLVMDATAEGALSTKVKELMSLAIAISTRCDGCLAHHAQAVLKVGATREEVAETISIAILMGGGPSAVYGVYGVEAFRAYDIFAKAHP